MMVMAAEPRFRAALEVAAPVGALVVVAQLEGDEEELPADGGSGPICSM